MATPWFFEVGKPLFDESDMKSILLHSAALHGDGDSDHRCEQCATYDLNIGAKGQCSLCGRHICGYHTIFKCPRCEKRFDDCVDSFSTNEKCGRCYGTFCREHFANIGDEWFTSICGNCKEKEFPFLLD